MMRQPKRIYQERTQMNDIINFNLGLFFYCFCLDSKYSVVIFHFGSVSSLNT